jgi:hypothetical protein
MSATVGVLAAVAGSGIELGPVKLPTIARSRQIPMAAASIVVLVGVVVWAFALRGHGSGQPSSGGLRVVLVPSSSDYKRTESLIVNGDADQGTRRFAQDECTFHWRDDVHGKLVRTEVTVCEWFFKEPPPLVPGRHVITGVAARGRQTVEVFVHQEAGGAGRAAAHARLRESR